MKVIIGVLVFLAGVAHAADPCGGVKLEAATVRVGRPLTEAWVKTPEGKACLTDVVKEIDRNRLVRAVTVAAVVSDADRASGKGLATAKAIAASLVDAGLPKNRVFGLAPAPQRGGELGVFLRYVERAPEDVVARVANAGGASFLGADEPSLKPAEAGMPVLVNELVKTGPNSRVTIHLKDGSSIEVKPESLIKMAALALPSGGDRQVKIEVLSGGITADVRKATQTSRFEASSTVAVASVRGTQFRFGVEEEGGARLETLEGVVAIGSGADDKTIEVPAGKGTVVNATGEIAPPSVLPEVPQVVSPQKGSLGTDARLEWKPTNGAATYRVEVARDADFLVEARSANVLDPSISWPEPLAPGKWFWRVTGFDKSGFAGPSSKVYAFTAGK